MMTNKENKPLVSVIVPVYRAEKWINQCVDSLLGQSYRNIEVILVDDGSPDRSGAICDEYAAADSRVKVIHQPNGGVSVARQTGMDNATGEYTIHADPDDWVEPTMIEELVAKAREEDADMVICDYISEHDYGQEYNRMDLPLRPTADDLLRRLLLQQLHGSCWNKLVRRACSNGVRFTQDMRVFEDEFFNLKILLSGKVRQVSYLAKAFYHYRMNNESSLCHTINENTIRSHFVMLEYLTEVACVEENLLAERKKHVLVDMFISKRLDRMMTTFPEVHEQIVNGQRRYSVIRPVSSCLSIALRGWPRTAYVIYDLNMRALDFYQRFKKLIKH